MRRYRCELAVTYPHILDAQRVRFQVYSEEEALLDPARGVGGRDVDRFDLLPTTLHWIVYADDAPVGTLRLLLPSADVAREEGWSIGIGIERLLDLRSFAAPGIVVAEVTRYCVVRSARHGAGVANLLFASLLGASRRHGVTHLVAAATLDTDDLGDASLAYAVMASKGVMSEQLCAAPLAPPCPPQPSRRRIYTDEEHLRARRGELSGLALPRALSLFTGRLGGRCLCGPVYDPFFQVLAAPIASALGDVPVPVTRA